MTVHESATLTVKIGRIEFTARAEFTVLPGEPEVRYYPDGSGYPGSPDEIDFVESVECIECEYPITYDDFDSEGNLIEDSDAWGYASREDRPGAFAIADRWVLAEFRSGAYDDELFACADHPDFPYYVSEDDYV